ncbi:MAG TPA: hypothetical protein P5531_06785 [Bacteroidales bacterium]|nr:hypothetical protein [Bacteroidales bacterium]HSA44535.1 hypothetical protein [Bacteroidales bacterium]
MLLSIISLSDGGNIVIVILTIAWILYSFYRKSQKVKASRPGQAPGDAPLPAEPEEGRGLGEWFEEVILGEEFTEKKSVPRAQAAPASSATAELRKAPEEVPFLMNELMMYRGGEYAPLEEKPAPVIILEEEEESSPGIMEDFDIRKAVVFSEILKRPYA